jgi:hypothetical protein
MKLIVDPVYAERDREYDADLARRCAVMHERCPLVEDAVFVHRGKDVDVRADRDNHVGFGYRSVCAAEAVATERSERERVRRREASGEY